MAFLLPTMPDTTTEGPRLSTLSVTDSAYGRDIPIAFGTVRLAGNVIWATDLREEKITQTSRVGGKGGGRSTQTSTTYRYHCSFAVAFAEGEAHDVLRIWADSKLIYSSRAGDRVATKDEVVFRFYTGSESQGPDAAIVADIGDDAVAHRGVVYLVLDDLPLEDYGNRIPSITAEINFAARQAESLLQETGDPVEHITATSDAQIDYETRRMYVPYAQTRQPTQAQKGVAVLSLDTLQPLAYLRGINFHGLFRGSNDLLATDLSHDYIVDALTGARRKTSSKYTIVANTSVRTSSFGGTGVGLTRVARTGVFRAFVTDDYTYFDDSFREIGSLRAPTDGAYTRTAAVADAVDDSVAYGAYTSAGKMHVYTFSVVASISVFGRAAIRAARIATLTPSQVDTAATSFRPQTVTLASDGATSAVIVGVDVGTSRRLVSVASGVVQWSRAVPFVPQSFGAIRPRLRGTLVYHDTRRIVRIDLRTGALDTQYSGTASEGDLAAAYYSYDDEIGVLYSVRAARERTAAGVVTEIRRLLRTTLGGRARKGSTAAAIVETVAAKAGLDPTQHLRLTGLSSDTAVDGYVIDSRTTAKDALRPLAELLSFGVAESDGRLVFRDRGRYPVTTIREEELVAAENAYTERREQDVDLPVSVSVQYIGAETDYQDAAATASRVLAPTGVVSSRNRDDLSLPAVLSADAAKQAAEKRLFTAWAERTSHAFSLSQKWLWLDPEDVCTLALENGVSVRARMARADIGADFSMRARTVQEVREQYDSTVAGDAGTVPTQEITDLAPTQGFYLDAPLLRDDDALDGKAHRAYFAGGNYDRRRWPGCVVSRSADRTAWEDVLSVRDEVSFGVVTAPPKNPASYWRPDAAGTMEVAMLQGELESVTDIELLNGANGAVLLRDDGQLGIVQYRTVTALGDGQYRLSYLARGRRGSERMDRDYTGGEFFLALSTATLAGLSVALSERGLARTYRAITVGALPEAAREQSFTCRGRDAMPYAPVHPTAQQSGGDIVLGWTRRTRLGGERDLVDGGDGTVPLGETAEKYEIDIYDSRRRIVRQVTDLATPTYTYTAAQQTADTGAIGDVDLAVASPGFEDGLTGWTVEAGTPRVNTATDTVLPHTGTSYLAGGAGVPTWRMYQDLAVSATHRAEVEKGTAHIRLTAWQNCRDRAARQDTGRVWVECQSDLGLVYDTFDTPSAARGTAADGVGDASTWERVEVGGTVASQTRSFRVYVEGGVHTYFDDVRLTLQSGQAAETTISIDVYQISDTVGRGFRGEFRDLPIEGA